MKSLSELRSNTDLLALSVLFATMPIAAALASKLVFWSAILAVIIALFGRCQVDRIRTLIRSKWVIILVSILLWSGLSCIWSIQPTHSFLATTRLLLIVGAFLIIATATRQLNERETDTLRIWARRGGWLGLLYALAAVSVVAGYSLWSTQTGLEDRGHLGNQLNYFNRTAAVLLILAWPISTCMKKDGHNFNGILFLFLIGIFCFILPSTALFIAYIFGLSMFALATISLRISRLALLLSLIAYIVLLPGISIFNSEIINLANLYISNPVAEIHRIEVWNFCLTIIAQNPLIGLGLDMSHFVSGGDNQILLYTAPDGSSIMGPLMPLHPHSALIQIWLEIGLVGLLLTAILFIFVIRSIPIKPSSSFADCAASAAIGSCFILAVLSFDIWQGWWLCTLFSAVIYNSVFIKS